METKKCYYCGINKPLEELKKDKRRSHGRASECKKCHNKEYSKYGRENRTKQWERLKQWRENNRPHVNAQALKYQQTPYGKIKKSAHDKVYHALKTGRIKKQDCEVCGLKAQAHHEDYSKPLDVKWLCRKHHAEIHNQ